MEPTEMDVDMDIDLGPLDLPDALQPVGSIP